MRVLIAANESIGYNCFKILLEEKQQVVGVITNKITDRLGVQNIRIKKLAGQYKINLYQPENINHPDFVERIEALKPDIIFNISFLQIYKRPLLDIPTFGCINFHPGILPQYAGATCLVWAIFNREKEYGVTLHYITEKIDAGDIISFKTFQMDENETALSLLLKCYQHGTILFKKTLRNILNENVVPIRQDFRKRRYYSEIPNNGIIDVKWSTERILDFVRSLTFAPLLNPLSPLPYSLSPPMLKIDNQEFIVTSAKILQNISSKEALPGQIIGLSGDGLIVQTGRGTIILNLVDKRGDPISTERIKQGSFVS